MVSITDWQKEKDKIKNPPHYARSEIQPKDYMKAILKHDEYIGAMKWNINKYISRADYKGGIRDYYKAKEYLEMLINYLESKKLVDMRYEEELDG